MALGLDWSRKLDKKTLDALEMVSDWIKAANEDFDRLYAKVAKLEKKLNERK